MGLAFQLRLGMLRGAVPCAARGTLERWFLQDPTLATAGTLARLLPDSV